MCQELKDQERALRITDTEGHPRPISMLNEMQVALIIHCHTLSTRLQAISMGSSQYLP
jgi:hypothetical protein